MPESAGFGVAYVPSFPIASSIVFLKLSTARYAKSFLPWLSLSSELTPRNGVDSGVATGPSSSDRFDYLLKALIFKRFVILQPEFAGLVFEERRNYIQNPESNQKIYSCLGGERAR